MDENTVDELPPEGGDSPSEGAHDAAQSGFVPITEVGPDGADLAIPLPSRGKSTLPGSRVELVVDLATFLEDYVVFENPDCVLALALWILGQRAAHAHRLGVHIPHGGFQTLVAHRL